jgi:hypothetical protein
MNVSPLSQDSEVIASCVDMPFCCRCVKILLQFGIRNLRRKQGSQSTYNIILGRVRVTFLPWKIHTTYNECGFVALVMQHAKCMGRIIMSPLT